MTQTTRKRPNFADRICETTSSHDIDRLVDASPWTKSILDDDRARALPFYLEPVDRSGLDVGQAVNQLLVAPQLPPQP